MKQRIRYRTGVVLAAGLGSRLLSSKNGYKNKPLVLVEGTSLLLRTLGSLELACDRVVIVLGFGADIIHSFVKERYLGPMELLFAVNHQYQLANGLSVLAAREYLDDEFIIAMADHVMDDSMVELAGNYSLANSSSALLVDYKLDTIFDMCDSTKVLERNGKIISIGKELKEFNCIDTGLFVCTELLLEALSDVYHRNGDVSLSEGIQKLSENGLMSTIDIKDAFWQDVDTEEMLEYAQKRLFQQKSINS